MALARVVATGERNRKCTTGVQYAVGSLKISARLCIQRATLMQQLLDNSKEFSGAVIQKIQAGKISPIDEVKANVVVASAEIDLTQALRDVQAIRFELASPQDYNVVHSVAGADGSTTALQWGEPGQGPRFSKVSALK